MKKISIYITLFILSFCLTVIFTSNRAVQADVTPVCSSTPIPTDTPALSTTSDQSAGSSGTQPIIYGSGSSTQAPASPTCTIHFASPTTPSVKRISPTQISLSWWPSTDYVDSQDIEYGYSQQSMPYGAILDATTTVYTINDLQPNKIIFVKVCAYKNGCQSCSPTMDP